MSEQTVADREIDIMTQVIEDYLEGLTAMPSEERELYLERLRELMAAHSM